MFWDDKIEGLTRDEMTHWQEGKLREVVRYAYDRIEFYRQRFDEKGIHPEEIERVEDIALLPMPLPEPQGNRRPYSTLKKIWRIGSIVWPETVILRVSVRTMCVRSPLDIHFSQEHSVIISEQNGSAPW